MTSKTIYLVLLQHGMDDLPIRLFVDERDAVAFANEVDEMPTDEMQKLFGVQCSTPSCVSVVSMASRKGIVGFEPIEKQVVRKFDDDECEYETSSYGLSSLDEMRAVFAKHEIAKRKEQASLG